jgi:hypothetical protein
MQKKRRRKSHAWAPLRTLKLIILYSLTNKKNSVQYFVKLLIRGTFLPDKIFSELIKGGFPQFKSVPLQLRNIADNQIDCIVADKKKVAELRLQTFKI